MAEGAGIGKWQEGRLPDVLENAEIAADPVLEFVRAALLIAGFELIGDADYEFSLRIAREAASNGYPMLR